jgi:hypothetical protein
MKTFKKITGDETWVYGYDPETAQQSPQQNLLLCCNKKNKPRVQQNNSDADCFFQL